MQKYAINIQNMHKSMYWHILHICHAALPTLLMLSACHGLSVCLPVCLSKCLPLSLSLSARTVGLKKERYSAQLFVWLLG